MISMMISHSFACSHQNSLAYEVKTFLLLLNISQLKRETAEHCIFMRCLPMQIVSVLILFPFTRLKKHLFFFSQKFFFFLFFFFFFFFFFFGETRPPGGLYKKIYF